MADALWLKCVDELKYQVPDNIFTMWIRPLSASMHDNTMVVNVPNQYFASYVEKNHLSQIQTILQIFAICRFHTISESAFTVSGFCDPKGSVQRCAKFFNL